MPRAREEATAPAPRDGKRKEARKFARGWPENDKLPFLVSCLANHWKDNLFSFVKLYKIASVFSKSLGARSFDLEQRPGTIPARNDIQIYISVNEWNDSWPEISLTERPLESLVGNLPNRTAPREALRVSPRDSLYSS